MTFKEKLLRWMRILVLTLAYLNLTALTVRWIVTILNAASRADVHLDWRDGAQIGVSIVLSIMSLYTFLGPATRWDAKFKYPRGFLLLCMAALLLYLNSNVLKDQVDNSHSQDYQTKYGSNPFACDSLNGTVGQCYAYWVCVFLSLILATFIVPEVILSLWSASTLARRRKEDLEMRPFHRF
ncbi:hypothetical protein BGZ83_004575 [Gryganskiella cystojenkinii]|nr:hypothetical protein BGZ83_004575 [Gryganskiella cystojenkinii]